jgi:hypothetical protein
MKEGRLTSCGFSFSTALYKLFLFIEKPFLPFSIFLPRVFNCMTLLSIWENVAAPCQLASRAQ